MSPTEILVSKHVSVLDRIRDGGGQLVFITRDKDDETDLPMFMSVEKQTWIDMGSPDVVTVTLEPGDKLN